MATLRIRFYLCLLLTLLTSCTSHNPDFDPAKTHHTTEGFKNNYIGQIDKPFFDLVRWNWEALRDGLPRPAKQPTRVVTPDLAFILANAKAGSQMQPAITWIGHATMLVQASGLNILTDPAFSERASPVSFAGPKRAQPPGVAMQDLPVIDVVLISHNHYDHLDLDSVVALNRHARGQILFIVPLGIKAWMSDAGITNVVELDWWQQYQYKGVEFHFAPVQHWSSRGLTDRNQTLWGGYAVFGSDFHWYFSGDSGYSRDFADTRARFASRQPDGFDLALIAIGAYEPRWFMKDAHVNPAEAVQIHQDLGSQRSVGVHWGTFNLTDESLDQPPKELAAALKMQSVNEETFFLMKIGETRQFPKRSR